MDKTNEEIVGELKRMGAETLLPVVEAGQITLVLEDDDGAVKGVLSAALVDAPEDAAWRVLEDHGNYHRFLPGVTTSRVLRETADGKVVRFTAGMKVLGIGGYVTYTYRLVVRRPYIDVYDAKTGEMSGYWAIFPAPGGGKVVLVHGDAAKDVRETHGLIRFVIERLPPAELGFHISPVAMIVNRMKKRMEKMAK